MEVQLKTKNYQDYTCFNQGAVNTAIIPICQYTLMFNVYFLLIAHISKCAESVIFLNNVRRSEKAVLRLRLVADVFSKIVLRNRVDFTILISNYRKTAGVNRGNFSDLNSAYFNL